MIMVDLDDLVEAMEDASESLNYFVDRETGEVVLVSDTLGFIEAGYQRIEMAKSRGRYEPVPISAVTDFSGDIEAYVDGLADDVLAEQLEEALDALDPQKRVDSVLEELGGNASNWSEFRKKRARARAINWLEIHGLIVDSSG